MQAGRRHGTPDRYRLYGAVARAVVNDSAGARGCPVGRERGPVIPLLLAAHKDGSWGRSASAPMATHVARPFARVFHKNL